MHKDAFGDWQITMGDEPGVSFELVVSDLGQRFTVLSIGD